MPQVVARELSILVRRVFDPAQSMGCCIGFKFGATDVEQWPQQMSPPQRTLARHPRQTSHPGPAQQSKQQGFCLIVTVLGGQQQFIGLSGFNKCPIARIPGGTLKAGAGLNMNVNHL